ncbi:TVC2 protein, partial [Rynchops niger]|nr:TVC2 protein [Rynchops niger]
SLFSFLAFFLAGRAQVLLKQSQASVTTGKSEPARIGCVAEGIAGFQSAYIHWYRHIAPKAPQRIPLIGSRRVTYDDNSHRNKYSSWKHGTNVCTFFIYDVNSSDEGTYYCACW